MRARPSGLSWRFFSATVRSIGGLPGPRFAGASVRRARACCMRAISTSSSARIDSSFMRQVYRIRNGVSIIRVYFQPDTNADTDAATIANLAVSDMKDLPPGTLPPVVLKSDASSLSVCLVTTNGGGMSDGALKDVAQNFVRNQLAGVPGASIPPGLRKEGTARSSRRSSLLAAAAPWSLTRRP